MKEKSVRVSDVCSCLKDFEQALTNLSRDLKAFYMITNYWV